MDRVISEWTLTATQAEPLLAGRLRKVPICVQGISVVQIENGKISRWSDYYDQLKSRRHGAAAGSWMHVHFGDVSTRCAISKSWL